jgi:hypothetical protein
MGWSSANDIFDPVARALISHEESYDIKLAILVPLINALQDGDWDTEDESLEEFKDDPAVVEAFRRQDVTLPCKSCGENERYCECLDGWHRG